MTHRNITSFIKVLFLLAALLIILTAPPREGELGGLVEGFFKGLQVIGDRSIGRDGPSGRLSKPSGSPSITVKRSCSARTIRSVTPWFDMTLEPVLSPAKGLPK